MTNQDESELSRKIVREIIAQGWGRPRHGHLISDKSEIYCDLNIYGDDFYDLVCWMHKEFGVQTMSGFKEYAPSESPFHQLRAIGRRLFGLAGSQYRSLRVADIASIITEGKWL